MQDCAMFRCAERISLAPSGTVRRRSFEESGLKTSPRHIECVRLSPTVQSRKPSIQAFPSSPKGDVFLEEAAMRRSNYVRAFLIIAIGISAALVPSAEGQTFTVLSNFTGSSG